MTIDKAQLTEMYLTMRRIRVFETEVNHLYAETKIPGFGHLYAGEEAIATGVCGCLRKDDYITSTHRGHGHLIAKGGETSKMMAELYARESGYCKGKGGSMHIANADLGILGANGIVGAGHCLSVGAGLSIQLRETDQVCICFFGDASTNQGTFHESLNLASVWKLPVVFVCENNFYGISVPQRSHMNITQISDRAVSYGIPGVTVDGNDIFAVYDATAEAVARARAGQGPSLIECRTYRHFGHFNGDPAHYRPAEEVEEWLKKDPIPRLARYMMEEGLVTEAEIEAFDARIDREIEEAIAYAEAQPFAPEEDTLLNVYTDIVEEGRNR
ncbi:MAG: thiamine pyrophosphate-dependent dehydrogenase E1 component subunit alpha [Bacillota bacterium]